MNLKRFENENEEQFIWRICSAKENGTLNLDWNEIAEIINREFRNDESEYRTESAYRKLYQNAKRFYDSKVFDLATEDSRLDEITIARHELRKEKQRLFDERTALNRVLREESRKESMYDMMKKAIENYNPVSFNYFPKKYEKSNCDFIIHLTDIHCGADVNSSFNTFNDDVLKERLEKYLDNIYDLANLYKPESAYVILGGDMIHGLIHVNSRIESKENIVEQIMNVSNYVSNFIYEIGKMFSYVEVHTTAGNHSRVTGNKEETTHGENFDLLVPYICEKELNRVENISFKKNIMDYDIASFSVRGHMVYATHGDKDSSKTIVYNMTKFARKIGLPLPDMCYLGHRHTNGLTTVDDVKVIESGCVDGMDNYCVESRLVGTPEQTVTVVTKERKIAALCDIQID